MRQSAGYVPGASGSSSWSSVVAPGAPAVPLSPSAEKETKKTPKMASTAESANPQDPPTVDGVSSQQMGPRNPHTWASLTSTRPRLFSSFMICKMAILTSTCTRFCTSDTWRILGGNRVSQLRKVLTQELPPTMALASTLTSCEPPWYSSAALHACLQGASPTRPGACAGSSLHPPETGI